MLYQSQNTNFRHHSLHCTYYDVVMSTSYTNIISQAQICLQCYDTLDTITMLGRIIKTISAEMPKLIQKLPYYDMVHINELQSIANLIRRRFSTLVVVGMGGAVLNCKSIVDFIDRDNNSTSYNANKTFKVICMYEVCMSKILRMQDTLNLSETAFMFISNSGNTVETTVIAQYLYNTLHNLQYNDFAERFIFVYANEVNNHSLLAQLHSQTNGIYVEYDKQMGGRFATFTAYNILIAMIMGEDISELCDAGNTILQRFFNTEETSNTISNAVFAGAIMLTRHLKSNRSHSSFAVFNSSYECAYDGLIYWYNTVLAETFGKDNSGIIPIRLNLPIDQHGMLQSILTNNMPQCVNLFETSTSDAATYNVSQMLKHHVMLQLEQANIPSRVITVHDRSLKNIGAMMMHMILETITAAVILNITPFNQPQIDTLKYNIATEYKKSLSSS